MPKITRSVEAVDAVREQILDIAFKIIEKNGYEALSMAKIGLMNWTSKIATLARPLLRLGNLSDIASASFTMALFPVSAPTLCSLKPTSRRNHKKN